MTALPPPYPLAWPDGQRRTAKPGDAQFRSTRVQAIGNVETSLSAFGKDSGIKVSSIQITSNVAGLRGGEPDDRGVSVWFFWDGEMRCIAVDRYCLVEWNLQAIHHVLEAERTKLRHGGLDLVRTSFRGFAALPAPPGKKEWWQVLGVKPDANATQISEARKRLAREHHEDPAMMQAINVAHDEGMSTGGRK